MSLVTIDLANAADYAIKTYGGVAALGLEDGDLNATDFLATMSTMISVMPNRSIFSGIATNSLFPALKSCVVAKLTEDLGVSLVSNTQLVVNIKKWYTNKYPVEIEVIDDTSWVRWTCVFDTDSGTAKISTFAETYNPNGGGGVKSVQRGTYTFSSSNTGTITISTVNPDKCMVLIDNGIVGTSAASSSKNYTGTAYGSYLVSLAETKLTVSTNETINDSSPSYGTISWQVIEFK